MIPFALRSVPTRPVTTVGQPAIFCVTSAPNTPRLNSLDQLRRESHILGWMYHLHAQSPPLVTASYINLLIALRCIFNELAWTEPLSELAHLIRREDIHASLEGFPGRLLHNRISSCRKS